MIREATPADVPALTRVVNLAYRLEEFFVHGDRTDEAEIAGMLDAGRFLVLEEEGRPELAGCVYVEVRGDRGYFGMLSIDPELQGGGRGRRLITAVEEACRAAGCGHLDLVIVDLRTELPAFYERLGFTRDGTAPWPEESRAKLKRPAHFVMYSKPL